MNRLATLGTASLAADGDESAQQPKPVPLLAYLAIARPRGAHRRDTILGVLWPDLPTPAARSALRQALHGLRKALGGEAVVSHGIEALELDPAALGCDLWDLEAASARGDHGQVVELYQGELLAGLFVPDAPAFDEWLEGERRRVRAIVAGHAWCVAGQRK